MRGNKILFLAEFMVSLYQSLEMMMNTPLEVMMDEVRKAGWRRFRPIKGQPIAEKDMRNIFRLVDLDKDGTISTLVKQSESAG